MLRQNDAAEQNRGRGITLKICIFDDSLEHAEHAAKCMDTYAQEQSLHFEIRMFTQEDQLLAYAAQGQRIDLLFADIDLGTGERSGLDVVRAFQALQPDCAVVYLTSYLSFATEVYETPHLYFVLKNELARRLPAVMNKMAARQEQSGSLPLYIKRKDCETIVEPGEILYCERQGRKTLIVTRRESLTAYQKISELMERLDPREFVRCHTSYIVHLRYVTKFQRTSFTMSNGQDIPISRGNYALTKQSFSDYISRIL